jgi:voltage-gated potassium channel Kch
MFINIALAGTVMVGTTIIHAFGTMVVFHFNARPVRQMALARTSRVSAIVLLMFIITLLEVLLWAIVYRGLGAIETLERALYFSMVTYTTLGYGDIVLPPQWHLLSSFEAANGIMMFGWTTSIVLASVQRIYAPLKSSRFGKTAQ